MSTTPGVGGVHGDTMRNFAGSIINTDTDPLTSMSKCLQNGPLYYTTMKLYSSGASQTSGDGAFSELHFDPSRSAPVGTVNAPRRWGALACVFLGLEMS